MKRDPEQSALQDAGAQLDARSIQTLFDHPQSGYHFARWGRPIAPILFGVEAQTIAIFKGAFEALCHLTGHQLTETDPELGSNFMMFFCRDWDELSQVDGLGHLIPELEMLVGRLKAQGAHNYRLFRFDADGGIRACFSFLNIGSPLAALPAETLSLSEISQSMVLWGQGAFSERAPLASHQGVTVLRPDIAAILRAAYDPVMPVMSQDASHAMRLSARAFGVAGLLEP